ncbi:unnamed protein product [Lactuca virosa]|uniref:Uncharacterized protein n=1 Tax=Lactuca virosa TaxID=75947 RepID=A0AAU9LN74_9ASTR|nr:unnamed protein product [Lactuca virosa]
MSRQKSGSGRAVEASLSSSPSLKGKRDVMAKHSEAMDFRDWCKNECVKLLRSKGLLYVEYVFINMDTRFVGCWLMF